MNIIYSFSRKQKTQEKIRKNQFHFQEFPCKMYTIPFNKLAFECSELNPILTSPPAWCGSQLPLISFTRIVFDESDMNTDEIEDEHTLYSLNANNSNLKRWYDKYKL